jgi:hypothetical protein
MASTYTVQQSIDWGQYFMGNRPLSLTNSEPALTSANIVMQVMLSPPFKWRWNRNSNTFAFTGGDTTVTLSDFGFIEKAYVTPGSGNYSGQNIEIPKVETELTMDAGSGRPHTIAPYLDNNAGDITFRFMPGNPDVTSQVTVIYQKKPTLLTAISQTWAPLPDEYGYVYNWGFLALMYLFADSQKFITANQKFISGLLALSGGLTEQQIAVFLGQWDFVVQNLTKNTKTQQSIQARQQ